MPLKPSKEEKIFWRFETRNSSSKDAGGSVSLKMETLSFGSESETMNQIAELFRSSFLCIMELTVVTFRRPVGWRGVGASIDIVHIFWLMHSIPHDGFYSEIEVPSRAFV